MPTQQTNASRLSRTAASLDEEDEATGASTTTN
jgi:hypothetical protein